MKQNAGAIFYFGYRKILSSAGDRQSLMKLMSSRERKTEKWSVLGFRDNNSYVLYSSRQQRDLAEKASSLTLGRDLIR